MHAGESDCGPEGRGFEPWIALLNSGFALTLRSFLGRRAALRQRL
jgi:hypothetical protein